MRSMWEKVRQAIRQFAGEDLGLKVEKTNLEEKKDSGGVDLVKVTVVLTGTREQLEEAAKAIPDDVLGYSESEEDGF